jgi:Flp pilus assembly protein TadG
MRISRNEDGATSPVRTEDSESGALMKLGVSRSNLRREKACSRTLRPGATIVESAVVLLITMTLTFAIFEYGRYYMLSQLVNNAAREGARLAVANTNTQNTAMIQNAVVSYLANQAVKDSSGNPFTASDVIVMQINPATGQAATDPLWYDSQFGSAIMVQVNAKFNSLFPSFGFLPTTVTLRGTAVMLSEAN